MTNQEAIRILNEQRNKFMDEWVDFGGVNEAYNMAVNLLKEQEAVKPRVSCVEQRCGNCNKIIEMDGWIACPWCGKPIKWEGR